MKINNKFTRKAKIKIKSRKEVTLLVEDLGVYLDLLNVKKNKENKYGIKTYD